MDSASGTSLGDVELFFSVTDFVFYQIPWPMGQPRYAIFHPIAPPCTPTINSSHDRACPSYILSRTYRALAGSQPQKGVTSYTLSPNRQRPLSGALHAAIFNTARRTKDQILFWLTPMVLGYAVMEWATEKYLCSAFFFPTCA